MRTVLGMKKALDILNDILFVVFCMSGCFVFLIFPIILITVAIKFTVWFWGVF